MRKMTPEWRLLCVLWVMSSLGVAGIATAMAYKPQTTTVQKAKPTQTINRLLKTDKYKPTNISPLPEHSPTQTQGRKYWYA